MGFSMVASDPACAKDGEPCAATQIRDGLMAYEFEPFFQPIVNLADSTLVGFEALARWRHGERGLVEPAEFIQIAEANNLIGAIDAVILHRAWRAFDAALLDCGRPRAPMLLSVNLSAANLMDDAVVARIGAMVADRRSPGIQLQLEITETVMIDDLAQAASVMKQLRALGVSFALDDFGVGYSSLIYLHRLPIDCIKIDRSFSEAIMTSPRSRAIVRAIIGLADTMELRAVAEGIAKRDVAEALLDLGCPYGQGLHFGEPVPASGLPARLR